MNNGLSSVHFDVMRRVRQGDPLSFYLFIIALEILAIYVRGSDEIKGINLRGEHEVKLTAFADDMTTVLKDGQSADNLLKVLNDFGMCSGLKLNKSKLETYCLGTSSSTNFHINLLGKAPTELTRKNYCFKKFSRFATRLHSVTFTNKPTGNKSHQ